MKRASQSKAIAGLLLAALWPLASAAAVTCSLTATFNNAGVEVVFAEAPTNGTQVCMFVRRSVGSVPYREAHPLSRTTPTSFAGSLFGLDPDTSYSIRLESSAFPSNQYVSVTTRADTFPGPTGATYHVAISGNDTNSGRSAAAALRTLGAALSKASAGNTILLYDGRFLEGDLDAPRSGTPTQPIVIRNAPGARPVLDGTDTGFAPSWTTFDAAHGVYRTPCVATPENAYLNGEQLFHYLSLSDLSTNRWNMPAGYYADGANLYARFPGNSPPGSHVVTIPRFTTGLTLDGVSFLHVIGIEFCYYGYGPYHRAIYINNGRSNLVDQCVFHHDGAGVALKRASSFNTIQRCLFTESPISAWSWHAVKDGGVEYEGGGVVVYSSTVPNAGNVVRHNTFTNMFDGSEIGSGDPAGPTTCFDYHDNTLSDCADDAIEVDGAGVNNRIYGNAFNRFLTGVSVAPCAIGPTYVFRNVLSNWRPVEDFGGYPFKFNVDSPLNIQWVYLYHNTCWTPVPGQHGFLFKNYSQWTNVVSRNNIFAGTAYALESWSPVNPVDFDYDALYTTSGALFVRWAGVSYRTLGAFAAGTGQEPHGCSFEPCFRAAADGDYRLRHASPLIDRGVTIPGLNDDCVGSAPDIGAFEFVAEATNVAIPGGACLSGWAVASSSVYRLQYATNLPAATWHDVGRLGRQSRQPQRMATARRHVRPRARQRASFGGVLAHLAQGWPASRTRPFRTIQPASLGAKSDAAGIAQ